MTHSLLPKPLATPVIAIAISASTIGPVAIAQDTPSNKPETAIPERFHGIWDDVASDCSIYSDGRLVVSSDKMVFYEAVAKITDVKTDGDAVLVSTQSSGEGEEWEAAYRLSLKDDRLLMKVVGSQWGPFERKRCPQ